MSFFGYTQAQCIANADPRYYVICFNEHALWGWFLIMLALCVYLIYMFLDERDKK